MVGTVRVARGLTQTELSARSGISQAVLSKLESGAVELDSSRLAALSVALKTPEELLRLPYADVGAAPFVFHRKRSTLPVSKANQIRAELELTHLQVERILGERRPTTAIRRTPLPDDGFVSPEELAQDLRKELSIAPGPIPDLTAVLEAAGVVVLVRDFGSALIDAIMSWPDGRVPLVIAGMHAPADRQRFTMAHELGHAVMHQVPTENQESEADRFASELLMPASDIAPALKGVTVPRLAQLKPVWGVSMAALLRRARDLGGISESQYKQVNIEFSKAGYRSREPGELPRESPSLLDAALEERILAGEDVQMIAESALMTEAEFRRVYGGEADER